MMDIEEPKRMGRPNTEYNERLVRSIDEAIDYAMRIGPNVHTK
jgi:hypothetical protein